MLHVHKQLLVGNWKEWFFGGCLLACGGALQEWVLQRNVMKWDVNDHDIAKAHVENEAFPSLNLMMTQFIGGFLFMPLLVFGIHKYLYSFPSSSSSSSSSFPFENDTSNFSDDFGNDDYDYDDNSGNVNAGNYISSSSSSSSTTSSSSLLLKKKIKDKNSNMRFFILIAEIHETLLGLIIATGCQIIFQGTFVVYIGRFRPDFLDYSCQPYLQIDGDKNELKCSVDEYDQGLGRASSPSGHVSLAAGILTYYSLYAFGKLFLSRSAINFAANENNSNNDENWKLQARFRFFKLLLSFAPIFGAMLVACQRYSDHKHHFSDCILGLIDGMLFAIIAYSLKFDILSGELKPYIYNRNHHTNVNDLDMTLNYALISPSLSSSSSSPTSSPSSFNLNEDLLPVEKILPILKIEDWITSISLIILSFFLYYNDNIKSHRIIYDLYDDYQISKEYKKDDELLLPFYTLPMLAILPIFVIIFISMLLRNNRIFRRGTITLLFTIGAAFFMSTIMQLSTGRLTPDFLDRCHPNATFAAQKWPQSNPYLPQYYYGDSVCEDGEKESDSVIRHGRMSFPSTFAVVLGSSFTFLSFFIYYYYLPATIQLFGEPSSNDTINSIDRKDSISFLKIFWSFILPFYSCLLLITPPMLDNRAHHADTILGLLLGMFAGVFTSFCSYQDQRFIQSSS